MKANFHTSKETTWGHSSLFTFQTPPCSSTTTKIIPGCNSLLPRAAAGTVHFQLFLNTELQTPGMKNSSKISEKEWHCLNSVFSSGAHWGFASRALSVPNPLQGTKLVHPEWNPGVVAAQEGKECMQESSDMWNNYLDMGFLIMGLKMFSESGCSTKTHLCVFLETMEKSRGMKSWQKSSSSQKHSPLQLLWGVC